MKKNLLLFASTLTYLGLCHAQNGQTINANNNLASIKDKTVITTPNILQKTIPSKVPDQTFGGTAIWGVGSSTGVAEAEFSNFAAWSAVSINDNGGAVTPGNAFWTQSMLGYSQGGYWSGTTPIASPSQANGVAIFDSDFLDNNGVAGAFGTGTSPSAHKGELISPTIDLTGYTDSALTVTFYGFYRNFNITELSVSMSVDGGTIWSTVDYRTLLPDLTEGWVNVTFPNVTAGVSNLTAVKLKFTFDGDYFFAIVDDITISVADPYDFTFAPADPNGTLLAEMGDQVLLSNNRYFPLSQLKPNDFYFGGNVKNRGAQNVYLTDNAQLNLTIQQFTGSWNNVYTQSITIDTVLADDYGSLFIDSITDLSWLQIGDFRAIYTVSSDVTDANSANDTIMHMFTLTDDSYASKVDLDINGNPYASRSIFPGGGPFSAIEYGSVFRFPNAGTNNLSIDSISFTYYTPNAYTGNSNQSILVNIYEWTDTNMDAVPTDASELTLIGVGTSTLTGLTAGSGYGVATATGLVDPGSGNAMAPLQNNKHYFISLGINPSLFGGAATFTSTDMIWYGASEVQNYYLNGATISASNPDATSSPIIVTDGGGTSSFYWTGFGMDISPSIGVHLSGCAPVAGTDIITECDSLTWIDGTTYYANNTTATHNLTASNGCDSIVTLNLTITNSTIGTDVQTACGSYTWIDGNNYTSDENSATFTLTNSNNCDSVVTLNLTINTVDVSVTNNSPMLTANEAGATYRWLDCDNAYAVIPSETGQSYTATANGNYAVEVTMGSCTDTSACENITGVGINTIHSETIMVYPVPANNNLTISGLDFSNGFTVELMNNIGQVIISNTYQNKNQININLNNINQGTYQLVIKGDKNVITKTITVIK